VSLSASHPRTALTLPQGSGSGNAERIRRELSIDAELSSPEHSVPDAERTSALIVSALTLACTAVSLFDLYLLASHAT
jgi:hypothetical protein